MNVRPLLGFFWKHGAQVEALVDGGAKPDGHLVLDVADATHVPQPVPTAPGP